MGIGNQNFYVIEEFIGRGILKEETFAGRNFRDFADFSSISIEVNKTVFVLYFFYEKILSI